MALPLGALLGLLATGGGYVANTVGANAAANAREDALTAERIRQQALDQQARAVNANSQDRYKDFEGKQEEKAKTLGDYFAPPPEAGPANAAAATAGPTSSNSIVTREMAKQSGKAKAFTDQQGAALGDLRSFGDLLGENSRLQARDAGQIGQIGGFKRGSSNILPLELDAAAQEGAGARMLGDILGLAGSIGINAGLSGAFAPTKALSGAGTVTQLYPKASGAY